jgi:hypothetical protein
MHSFSFESYYEDIRRVNALIGNVHAQTPSTADNVARDRLLRVVAGLRHLLVEVIPQIEDERQRYEVYLWVDGIYTITRCEECDAGVDQ